MITPVLNSSDFNNTLGSLTFTIAFLPSSSIIQKAFLYLLCDPVNFCVPDCCADAAFAILSRAVNTSCWSNFFTNSCFNLKVPC